MKDKYLILLKTCHEKDIKIKNSTFVENLMFCIQFG